MIADKLVNLKKYADFAPYADVILEFAARVKQEQLPDGRYELRGEELFAMIQSYRTQPKENGRMEAHRKYCDLQYILEGEECIFWEPVEDLEVEEDRTPGADIYFCRRTGTESASVLRPGMFGFYLPSDGHMPGIAPGECAAARKIVFKIRYQEN